jgi:predicted DCC family thiol-disulfide oxidoreductase YuxK
VTRAVLLWDGDCGFCRWCVARVLRADGDRRLRPVTLQSEEGERLTAHMGRDVAMASWHLAMPDGRLLSGGAAFAGLGELVPAFGPLGAAARRFPGPVDRLYRFGAGHRDRFGAVTRRFGDADRDRRRIAERAFE